MARLLCASSWSSSRTLVSLYLLLVLWTPSSRSFVIPSTSRSSARTTATSVISLAAIATKVKEITINHTASGSLAASAPALATAFAEKIEEKTILVRRMTLKDVAEVFHIGESVFTSASFPQLYRTWSPYEVTDSMATDHELCFVAEELIKLPPRRGRKPKIPRPEVNVKLVGFVLASIAEKRKREQSCGYLGWVAVIEDHQRQGIGTRLADEVEKQFLEEGITTVVADTPEMNVASRNFLEKMGFGNTVQHVYMSLNIAKWEEENDQPRQARKALPEQKTVKIRQMMIDDLAAVHALGEEVFTGVKYPNLFSMWLEAEVIKLFDEKYPNLFRMWSEAEVVELFGSDSDNCFVAEVGSEVFGFVLGTTIEKRHSSWKYGYLLWLAVSPRAQRLGVGKKLFEAFKDQMMEEDCRMLLCDTQADNFPARGFFEKEGFTNTEDHVYYSKTLGGPEKEEEIPSTTPGALPQPHLMRLKSKKSQSKVENKKD